MVCGVLVDRRRSSVLLFNDRFGVHRIYLHQRNDTFTFASEAKAILQVRPHTRTLSTEGLGHFLGFGTVFDNKTLFQGYAPAGRLIVADCRSRTRHQGPLLRRRNVGGTSSTRHKAFYARLIETIAMTVPAYFRSASTVGLSLTGGLDTRIVMAGIPKDADPLPSYTYSESIASATT